MICKDIQRPGKGMYVLLSNGLIGPDRNFSQPRTNLFRGFGIGILFNDGKAVWGMDGMALPFGIRGERVLWPLVPCLEFWTSEIRAYFIPNETICYF